MKIIIITGPSATGKTKLALQYAKKENGELINFDSRQIYKYLDIITGKDIVQNNLIFCHSERNEVKSRNLLDNKNNKIWLYDLVDPKEYFSSFDFTQVAIKIIKDILCRKKTPILVGGTYLYLYHLLYNVETENIPPNTKLREQLNNKEVPVLQQKLKKIDQKLFENLNESDRLNPRRLIRKIEIAAFYHKKGKRVPTKMKFDLNNFFKDKEIEFVGLNYKNRDEMLHAIKQRVDKRLEQGALDEVTNLLKQGYTENDPGMKTIGYQQIIQFLKGKKTKQEAIEEWTLREYQYTKRQLTFMKKDPNIVWRNI